MFSLSRRSFLASASSFTALGGCRSMGFCGGRPNLRFGVISDIHVITPDSTDEFQGALEYFRDRKVDAVIVSGDLSDWGLRSGLKYVADAWYSVFPNDCAPDGRKVEKLFCTGNHDYDGFWYGDMTLDMHVQGYSEEEALVKLGMKKCWEEAFHESFAPVRRRTVKGYDFISAEWSIDGKIPVAAGDTATSKKGLSVSVSKDNKTLTVKNPGTLTKGAVKITAVINGKKYTTSIKVKA